MESPILPSPLCDKELEDVIFSVGRMRLASEYGSSQSESDAELMTAAELRTTTAQLPCWTRSDRLTNEVQSVQYFIPQFYYPLDCSVVMAYVCLMNDADI